MAFNLNSMPHLPSSLPVPHIASLHFSNPAKLNPIALLRICQEKLGPSFSKSQAEICFSVPVFL